ncbi:MAG TPA: hypothetical protein V6C72_06530, partial [Chroococcales cyanobacterium]
MNTDRIQQPIPDGQGSNVLARDTSSFVPGEVRNLPEPSSEPSVGTGNAGTEAKSTAVRSEANEAPGVNRNTNAGNDSVPPARTSAESQTSVVRPALPDATANGVLTQPAIDNVNGRQVGSPSVRAESGSVPASSDLSRPQPNASVVHGNDVPQSPNTLRTNEPLQNQSTVRNTDVSSSTARADVGTGRPQIAQPGQPGQTGQTGLPENLTGSKSVEGGNTPAAKPGETSAPGANPNVRDTTSGAKGIDGKTSDQVGTRIETSDKMPNPKVDSGRTDGGTVKMGDPRVDSGRSDGGTSGMRDPRGFDGRGIAQAGPSGGSAGTPFGGDDSRSIGTKGIKTDGGQVLPPGMLPESRIGQPGVGPKSDASTGRQPASQGGPRGGSELVPTGEGFGTKSGSKSIITPDGKFTGTTGSKATGSIDAKSPPGSDGRGSGKGTDTSVKSGDGGTRGNRTEVPVVAPTVIPIPDITGGIKQIGQKINDQIKGIKESVTDAIKTNAADSATGPKGQRGEPLAVPVPGVKSGRSDVADSTDRGARPDRSEKPDGPKTVRTSDGKSIVIGGPASKDAAQSDGNTVQVKGLTGGLVIGLTGIAGGLK